MSEEPDQMLPLPESNEMVEENKEEEEEEEGGYLDLR